MIVDHFFVKERLHSLAMKPINMQFNLTRSAKTRDGSAAHNYIVSLSRKSCFFRDNLPPFYKRVQAGNSESAEK